MPRDWALSFSKPDFDLRCGPCPAWVGLLSLWIEDLTRHDYKSVLWRAASQGMFLLLLTPVCAVLLFRKWRSAKAVGAKDHVLFSVLGAPTFVAVLAVAALFCQTFVGFPLVR